MLKAARHLTFWVLLAVVLGVAVGHFFPAQGERGEHLGKMFVELVKLFVYPLIFLTITLGIAAMSELKQVGKVGGKAILYFEVVTTLALVIGILVAYAIEPGRGVLPPAIEGADAKIDKFKKLADDFSWLHFLKDNLTLQVLIAAIICGIILNRLSFKAKIVARLEWLQQIVFLLLGWVMLLAPLGAFGGMAATVGKYGLHALIPLAKLMLTVYITMALFIFVGLGSLMRASGVSLLGFLRYIRSELLIVLGTSSSESALPSLMEKLERMGCKKSIVGLVVPAGYSFNLDGTTIYLSMAVVFLSQVYDVRLGWSQLLTIVGVLMVTSKGAAGVTGSGFAVLYSTLTAVKVIPPEGIVLLLGVDRFMSEARAITNFIGNGVATVVLAVHEKAFDRAKMAEAWSNPELQSSGSEES
ncbi:MAG: cation:dicarboxylase symporter family transporter [Pirellulales bacterium]